MRLVLGALLAAASAVCSAAAVPHTTIVDSAAAANVAFAAPRSADRPLKAPAAFKPVASGKRLTAQDSHKKKLAGPPSEFPKMVLPSARQTETTTSHALFMVTPKTGQNWWSAETPVDSTTEARFAFFSPLIDAGKMSVEFALPTADGAEPTFVSGDDFVAQTGATVVHEDSFGIGGTKYPSTTYIFRNPAPGNWHVKLTYDTAAAGAHVRAAVARAVAQGKAVGPEPDSDNALNKWPIGGVIVYNESDEVGVSNLNSYDELLTGGSVGVRAHLTEAEHTGPGVSSAHKALKKHVQTAMLEVVRPDGERLDFEMHDDGEHDDLLANDGVFAASFETPELGTYQSSVVMRGTNAAGNPVMRTASILVPVVTRAFDVTAASVAHSTTDDDVLLIKLQTDATEEKVAEMGDETFRVYTEVYGQPAGAGADAEPIAVAWVGGMVDLVDGALTVELNANWLQQAGATTPLTLKGMYIQDREDFVPIVRKTSLPCPVAADAADAVAAVHARVAAAPAQGITAEMRQGKNPYASSRSSAAEAETHGLILVHGYCAPTNNWPLDEFTDAVHFEDFEANRSTDEFALLIKDAIESYHTASGIGHSHGGVALAHLHAYYFSKLGETTSGRKIQSVGSPYGGNTAAGTAAGIGSIFGLGCGSNDDLSLDGGQLWRSALPEEPRDDVYYYRTQNGEGNKECATGMGLILAKGGNDGLAEIVHSNLEGGNDMGIKDEFCHSEGMKWPAQTRDSARNAEMNEAAAR